eukprot:gene8765-8944_t
MTSAEVIIPIFTSKDDMRAFSRQQKLAGKKIAFVPTMGYLHKGHLSLVEAAKQHADVIVASIYVNPTQFSANEDFDIYPRNPLDDRLQLQAAGCAAIFEPPSLYHQVPGGDDGVNVVGRELNHPDAHETWVAVERLQQGLCGGSRPHFFRGVATVVSKLFHIVEPDVAVFGQKDYQQWRLITRMVRDLDFPITIIGMPITREEDGLAMSSRNARLSAQSRSAALSISRALNWAKLAVQQQQVTQAADIQAEVRQQITAAGGQVDYVEVNVRIADLFPPAPPGGRRIAADGLAPCADGPASPLTTSSSQSLEDSSRTGNDGSGTAGSRSPVDSSTDSLQRQVLSVGPLPLPPGIQQALQTVSGNERTTQVTPQPVSVSLSSLWCTPGSIDCPTSVVPDRRGDGKLLLLRQHRRLKHQQAAASIRRMTSSQQRRTMLMVRSSTQLPERIQQQVATIPGLQQASKVKPSPHQVSLSELNPTSSSVSSTGDALGLRRLLSGREPELPDDIQQQLQTMSDSQQQFSSIRPAAGDVSLDEINDFQGGVRSSGLSGTNDSNRRRLTANNGVSVAHKLINQQALQGQQSMPASANLMPLISRRNLLWPVAQLAELFQWAHTRGSQNEKDDLLQLNFTTASEQQPAAVTRAITLADLNSLGRRALLAVGSRSSSEPTGQAEKDIKDSFGDVIVFNRPRKGTLANLCDAGDGGCK